MGLRLGLRLRLRLGLGGVRTAHTIDITIWRPCLSLPKRNRLPEHDVFCTCLDVVHLLWRRFSSPKVVCIVNAPKGLRKLWPAVDIGLLQADRSFIVKRFKRSPLTWKL